MADNSPLALEGARPQEAERLAAGGRRPASAAQCSPGSQSLEGGEDRFDNRGRLAGMLGIDRQTKVGSLVGRRWCRSEG